LDAAKGYMSCHAIDPSEKLSERTTQTENNSLFHINDQVSIHCYPVLSFLVSTEVRGYDKDRSQSRTELVVSKKSQTGRLTDV